MEMKYDENRHDVIREMTELKAALDPMLTMARNTVIVRDIRTALSGISNPTLLLTYFLSVLFPMVYWAIPKQILLQTEVRRRGRRRKLVETLSSGL
jgi:hypothetical protein